MAEIKSITILLDVYAYNQAFQLAQAKHELTADALFLLEVLKERRELNIDFAFAQLDQIRHLETKYGLALITNPYEEELLANYIMDLESKLKNANIIDFVRSVSPILYRLFMRLLQSQLPELLDFIHDNKSDQYDTWKFQRLHASDNPLAQAFVAKKRDSRLTSRGLVDFILLTDLPADIKETVQLLRKFEKSVRNPLAHLIKPFDEEELHRTTGFSSQLFLEKIIHLAHFSGVVYDDQDFYFDQVNAIIKRNYRF